MVTISAADGAKRALLWALLLILPLGLCVLRLAPPRPEPAGAPPGEFSAGRARFLLEALASGDEPRPTGSPAAELTRERAAAELRRLGYTVREEQATACDDAGTCKAVRNLVAELPGREPASAVALVSHYDSVPAGPGISDDLSGVAATLEVARILKAEPRPRHSVLFLIVDGEEAGLLGARAFLDGSPEAARVKAVVNLEARGTSGPSVLFETGPDNAWLLPLFARAVPHPRTSSVFSTLYGYLPNDTDFSVFRRRGIHGFNFAFFGDPVRYHTPLDNLASSSPASLQHQGENALATVRALAGSDLDRPHRGSAVFFDLLGLSVVWWPATWSPLLGAVPLLLIAGMAVRLRRAPVTKAEIGRGFLAWWAIVLLALVAGLALSFLLQATGLLNATWPTHGAIVQAAFWLLALAVAAGVAGRFRRAGYFGLWLGVWLVWALLGVLSALLLPGASYLFVVPAWAAGLSGLFLPGSSRTRAVATILPALVAAVLWFPLLILLYDGAGAPALWLIGALLTIVLTTLGPLNLKDRAESGNRDQLMTNQLL